MIELATAGDALEIYGLMKGYREESHSKEREYDPKNSIITILSWISDNSKCLVVRREGKIVAFAAIWIGHTFYKDKELDIEMFYIHPSVRGTHIARALASAICDLAKENNCSLIYTAGLSGGSKQNEKLYQNLWKKFGFNELGTIMSRSLDDE